MPVYGVPHSGGESLQNFNSATIEDNATLAKMDGIQKEITSILNNAQKNGTLSMYLVIYRILRITQNYFTTALVDFQSIHLV